jgi:outer membrane protein with beta-barrel domain
MKKALLILTAIVFVCAANAQFTLKPAAGLNFTDFSKNGNGDVKAKTGWQIGGSAAFGKKFYFEPGIFYVGKSTEYTDPVTSINDFKANINGIRVPLAVGLNAIGNEKTGISLRVFGGPSAFFVTNVGDQVNKDSIENVNFGLFAGAGLDFWKVFMDLSYEWSMTNVQKNVSDIDLGKSRTLFITAGIRMNF